MKQTALAAAGVGLAAVRNAALSNAAAAEPPKKPWFEISLAEWSLHRALFSGILDNTDFPRIARDEYDIAAVEYVNQFFKAKPTNTKYLGEIKKIADDHGVKSVLIMIDREGNIGDPDKSKRQESVENHFRWVEAAKFLGCHAIRLNANSSGSYDEQLRLCADGLSRIVDFGVKLKMNILVENHGGLSSNGKWVAALMKKVGKPNCGTLPDFGNFDKDYDRYKGVAGMMPWAKGVSGKTHDFDAAGNETVTDFRRMLKIVKDAGYRGYVEAEYEGERLSEPEGIRATKKLLEKVRAELA